MQGIEFEEDKNNEIIRSEGQQTATVKTGPIMKIVLKMGVSDATTANFILLGIVAVLLGITVFLYAGVLGETEPIKLTAEQQLEQLRFMQGAR